MADGSTAYVFRNKKWTPSFPLFQLVGGTAVSKSPFPNNSSISLFASGGLNSNSDSFVLTKLGWQNLNRKAPKSLIYTCLILSTTSSIWVTGGYDDGIFMNDQVYMFNSITMEWSTGESIQELRYSHSCSMILKHDRTPYLTQIIVGGYAENGTRLNSVEIFDDQSNSWIFGPQFPIQITSAAMVNDANNGIILIGGQSSYGCLDTFYQLRHAASQWEKMIIKLKTARCKPIAFYIPNNITDCL